MLIAKIQFLLDTEKLCCIKAAKFVSFKNKRVTKQMGEKWQTKKLEH